MLAGEKDAQAESVSLIAPVFGLTILQFAFSAGFWGPAWSGWGTRKAKGPNKRVPHALQATLRD